MDDIFDRCRTVCELIECNDERGARNELIKIMDYCNKNNIVYNSLINHLIRNLGLYPYLQTESASWDDRFVYEAFKVDVGNNMVTLHKEQSKLLKSLIDGKNLAISAPTSFGKSFVIDAFIAIKKPKNVVIIVPTIALMDETRRSIYKKFSSKYKIITTSDVELAEQNIFIFPQERAISYINKLKEIDMLIIDEFYKASKSFDKDRAPALLKAILKLGKIAKQKYYLSPNISSLKNNIITKDMEFVKYDLNTVYLEKHDIYKNIQNNPDKQRELLNVLKTTQNKTLIYAGTYSEIDNLGILLSEHMQILDNNKLLNDFYCWLSNNYTDTWSLKNLVKRGIGVHNGSLHRSLGQIQIKLFEEPEGIRTIISTSSIIEGVNTSAENIVIWKNKNGSRNLNDFTYNNIIGRGGRMFKHFVGQIYILEKPPASEDTELDINIPEEIYVDIDEQNLEQDFTKEQVAKIIEKKSELQELLQVDNYDKFIEENPLQSSSSTTVKNILVEFRKAPNDWKRINFLNSANTEDWNYFLYKILPLQPDGWETRYSNIVNFTKILSNNWQKTIPELLDDMAEFDMGINDFFKLERLISFKLAGLLKDINTLQHTVFNDESIDITPFITKVSNAFLPTVVYQLEEYGLPRMISRKIDKENIINFADNELNLHQTINRFKEIGYNEIVKNVSSLDDFDKYILKYFYEGI